jgi:hypothetical protein
MCIKEWLDMRRLTQQDFEKRIYLLYDNLKVLGEYHGSRSKIRMLCSIPDDIGNEHGEYITTADSILNQGKGCQKCANDIRSRAQTKYTHNKDFFTIPNMVNCYWAGFIAADGCIIDQRNLTILLKRADVAHLLRFCNDIEYDGTIYYGSSTLLEHQYYRCSIQISNAEKIIYYLKENFAIHQQKSMTYTHPILPDDLALAFIKGYIDGDGHIDTVKRIRLHICGTLATLSWIKCIFDKYSPAKSGNGKIAGVRKQGNLFVYEIGALRAQKMLNLLASIPCPGLIRKWNLIYGELQSHCLSEST